MFEKIAYVLGLLTILNVLVEKMKKGPLISSIFKESS
jgi:hypothetical protein